MFPYKGQIWFSFWNISLMISGNLKHFCILNGKGFCLSLFFERQYKSLCTMLSIFLKKTFVNIIRFHLTNEFIFKGDVVTTVRVRF